MPYFQDPNLDPDQDSNKKANEAPLLAGASQVVGGGAQTGAATTPASGAPTKSGSFQNLNSYLDANSGNGFGDEFVGKVNQDVTQAGAAQNNASNEFKGASDAGTTKQNDTLVNSAVNDPYAFSQDPNNVAEFGKQYNASYSGPKSFQDDASAYQKASGATQKAQDTTKAAQSEGGRFALLDNYFGNPNYNQGQKSLDNLLVQADPATQQGINQARANANQAQQNFQQQGNDLSNYAAGNIASSDAAKTAARAAVGTDNSGKETGTGALGDIRNSVNSTYQTDLNNYNTAVAAAKNNQLTDAQKTQLGLQSGSHTWGLSPSSYFTSGAAPTVGSVASPQQQQKMAALEGLIGGQNDFLPDATAAGTYDPNKAANFDAAHYKTDAQQAQDRYNNAINQNIFSSGGKSAQQLADSLGVDKNALGTSGFSDPAQGVQNIKGEGDYLNKVASQWGANTPAYIQAQKADYDKLMAAINSQYHYNDTLA